MPRKASPARAAIKGLLADYTKRLTAIFDRHTSAPAADSGDIAGRIFAALDKLGVRRGPGRPPGSKSKAGTAKAGQRRRPQSAAQKKANKLQGQYMGTIRLLPAAAKARVKALRGKDGVQAAIRLARQLKKAA